MRSRHDRRPRAGALVPRALAARRLAPRPTRGLVAAGLAAATVLAVTAALVGEGETPVSRELAAAPLDCEVVVEPPVPNEEVTPLAAEVASPRAVATVPQAEQAPATAREPSALLLVHLRGGAAPEGGLQLEVSAVRRMDDGPRVESGFWRRIDAGEVRALLAGEPYALGVGSLLRVGPPEALVVRATGQGAGGLAVVPWERREGELETRLEAEVWIDGGVRALGRVIPADHREVAAFLSLEGLPTGLLIGTGAVDADGGYELVLPGGHEYALCVLGRGRPGTLVTGVGLAGTQVLPAVRVPPDAVIEGWLGLRPGWERLNVRATLTGGRGHYVVGASELTWHHGAFEWRTREALLESGQRLRLGGLAPGVYELAVSGARGSERVSVGRLPPLSVRAPSHGVDLVPELARVRLLALRDGLPAEDATLSLVQDFGSRGRSHLQATTGEHGVAEFWLDPDAPARASAPGGTVAASFVPRELDGAHPRPVELPGGDPAGH